jgi:hypothetical protein
MIVSIRDVTARCDGCGGTDFKQMDPGTPRLATRMVCTRCRKESLYRDLLYSIGEEAMRRANDALAKLKKNSPRRKKPRK